MAKILVADDDEQVRGLIKAILEKENHEVLIAKCGNEAVQAYLNSGENVDLVITDLVMPGRLGVEVILELSRRDANIKFLAITGGERSNENPVYQPVVDLIGEASVLGKPFRIKELSDEVAAMLRSS